MGMKGKKKNGWPDRKETRGDTWLNAWSEAISGNSGVPSPGNEPDSYLLIWFGQSTKGPELYLLPGDVDYNEDLHIVHRYFDVDNPPKGNTSFYRTYLRVASRLSDENWVTKSKSKTRKAEEQFVRGIADSLGYPSTNRWLKDHQSWRKYKLKDDTDSVPVLRPGGKLFVIVAGSAFVWLRQAFDSAKAHVFRQQFAGKHEQDRIDAVAWMKKYATQETRHELE